jgi:hypothetical protein
MVCREIEVSVAARLQAQSYSVLIRNGYRNKTTELPIECCD